MFVISEIFLSRCITIRAIITDKKEKKMSKLQTLLRVEEEQKAGKEKALPVGREKPYLIRQHKGTDCLPATSSSLRHNTPENQDKYGEKTPYREVSAFR